MLIDLPPQIQNIPPKPAYAVIEQYVPNRLVECASNPQPLSRQTPPESEHFGGYITASGTLASGASGARQSEIIEFIPWKGKIPSTEIVKLVEDYKDHGEVELKYFIPKVVEEEFKSKLPMLQAN